MIKQLMGRGRFSSGGGREMKLLYDIIFIISFLLYYFCYFIFIILFL